MASGEGCSVPALGLAWRHQAPCNKHDLAHRYICCLSILTDLYDSKRAKIGPDPLREDADPALVWARVRASPRPVGYLLMEQSVISGVGNIYRAEILYKAGVHPERPGNTLAPDEFERIWRHSVLLLQRGFLSGSILTVDPADVPLLRDRKARRYIYNRRQCAWCGGPVASWDMAGRTVYACHRCQPPPAADDLAPARRAAMAAAGAVKVLAACAAQVGGLD